MNIDEFTYGYMNWLVSSSNVQLWSSSKTSIL